MNYIAKNSDSNNSSTKAIFPNGIIKTDKCNFLNCVNIN